jgi:hypothetical protein
MGLLDALKDEQFRKDMGRGLLDVGQEASNQVAGNLAVPVDGLAWLMRKAGLPIPANPVGGSDWMAQKGLTRPVQAGAPKMAGEALGLLAPLVATKQGAAATARQLNQWGENLSAPVFRNSINTPFNQRGVALIEDQPYWMGHRPSQTGATAADVTQNVSEMGLPKDFYSNPHFYEQMTHAPTAESFNMLQQLRGKPDGVVTLYRAGPKNELNPGDWVTLSKKYAEAEAKAEGVKVHKFKARAKDIEFAGDSINEFGFFPK